MSKLLAAVGSLALSYASVSVTWNDCGTVDNHIKIYNVTWSPNPIVPGDNVTIYGHGYLNETLTDTTVDITIAGGKHKFDGCKGTEITAPLNLAKIYFPPAGCPLAAGQVVTQRYVWLSKSMPKGKTSSHLSSVDQNGQPTLCLDVTLENK